jgi:hypothetical protein
MDCKKRDRVCFIRLACTRRSGPAAHDSSSKRHCFSRNVQQTALFVHNVSLKTLSFYLDFPPVWVLYEPGQLSSWARMHSAVS